ncbi:hypothetical protein HOP50_15g76220 [Chloropicon primus]|uniref:Uncharacterized protein n=1 Tax=Chloropicon primus TaxID=1764295 RepID=A0A5B8MY84_9CHLO|nr:hypothetical protein A3770_15p75940 [Chloropicon primus]UPR04285.1 hypothetical protein HOP50_15g76220 [Chloropicon primus]|mmetsp:Transcript_2852/g.7798  ORF Transcript_2852/g.7798 Transcript_2852/m.7798 type:complete len:150 (+) Transcript_2852:45-494(+)|eukprot:QDZ25076.1 hypothetical protein A3770_15p75940 [Chloropicon primus]
MERMEEEIRALRKEAEALNSPATFSKSAKLARKARALEKELQKRRERESKLQNTVDRTLSGCKWLAISLGVAVMWGKPALEVDASVVDLWPLGSWLKWPDCSGYYSDEASGGSQGGGTKQAISTLALCLMVSKAVSYALRGASWRRRGG